MFGKTLNTRLHFILLAFIVIFSILITRLVFIQLLQSSQLRALASEQHNLFTEIQPLRGTVFDCRLSALAVDRISYDIYATNELPADEKIANRLAALLDLDVHSLAEKINSDKNFVWLKRKVNPEVSAQLKDLNINGIGQIREYKRFYPNGALASHILGFTNIDNQGLEGLELYCDAYLTGIKGWRLAQRDAKRQELICWGYKTIAPTDGYDLVLTIDSVIQNIAERELRKAAQAYHVASATAIVMEPKSGEILALCNYPDYDLNNFQEFDQAARRNLALTDTFEPGSSFKFVTAAAALEENLVKLEDKFFCEKGNYRIAGRILHDYKPYGMLSFKEVIEHSSNIGTVKVAQVVGGEKLYKYIKDFGFGSLTGINLPGEVNGTIRPPRLWSKVSISAIPIGQEVSVTPIQLITAMSCVANDGILVRPKIVESIQRKDGQIIKTFPAQNIRRVISADTATALKEILTGAVENGTGQKAKVPGCKSAGKTGTAQKVKPSGGYYQNKYCSTFVGFVPADQPMIAILVVLNEPHPLYFGGTVCAPVFSRIATDAIRYLKMLKAHQAYPTK